MAKYHITEPEQEQTVKVGHKVPDFKAQAFHKGDTKTISLSDYKGKWVIMAFYPADFTFVCPTELEDLAEQYAEIQKLDTEVLSVSTDTVFVHKAWHDHSPSIKKINYPMMADPTGAICKLFGTYIPEEGLSLRGTFIIDPDRVLKAMDVHDNSIGRSSDEIIRKLQAAQYVRGHDGEVCPARWKPGAKTLKPGMDLVGKI
ncbi:MAG: alkyl hydroperoxide reductase subunit C [Nanoarchaeota archaeon]